MDINDLRTITMVISMLTFVGIIWWAYSRGNQKRFDEAAALPFAENDDEDAASGMSHPR
jgi:cytochrome c oxidase cbb3-type subunit 4